ncbi:MAG: DUF2637 domain-containing protein [Dehalococcoidia bacterium]
MAARTPAPGTPPRPGWVVWLGLGIVLAAAAALSFHGLRDLALSVRIPEGFAWLVPVVVDGGAAVSCAVWLGRRSTPDAARLAGRLTGALLAVTVVGNAAQLAMTAHAVVPPWWVAALVGAVPPAVVGETVRLVVLLVRTGRTDEQVDRTDAGPDRTDGPDESAEWTDPWERWADDATPVPDRGPDRTGSERTDDELLAALGALADRLGRRPGRNAVAAELEIGASRATRLLREFDQTGPRRTA